ncbi:MAG: dihydrofolate reductase [Candidatus Riflebacteria bacterium]|nr:dihydrofolate reductase [Candidatus Riflebacteria bacterium]
MGLNRVIGDGGKIPWKIPGEQTLFRQLTEGKVVLMGRKTMEAIGNPLPKRTNVIMTRQKGYTRPGCLIVNRFEEAIAMARTFGTDLIVAGGAEIYSLAMPAAKIIHLSIIQREFPGDAFFPEISAAEFFQKSAELVSGSIPYIYTVYERCPGTCIFQIRNSTPTGDI